MADTKKKDDQNKNFVEPKKKEMRVEFGVPASMPFSTPYYDIAMGTKTGEKGVGDVYEHLFSPEDGEPNIRQMVAMRRSDGQARALYRLLTLPLRSALRTSSILPAEGEAGGEDEAAFVKNLLMLPPAGGGMETPFPRFIAQMLTAVFDGFSAFEQVYQVPKFGPLKGKITLLKLAHRPSETISFLVGPHGDFEGFRQQTHFNGEIIDVVIPKRDAFYYAAQEEERPFYGVSFFQAAFYHYDVKKKMYFLTHLAAQHRATGSRHGEYPANASNKQVTDFLTQLADFGVMQAMAYPNGFKVTTDYPTGSFNYLELINHHDSQMSKSVLAGFIDQNQGGPATLVDFGDKTDGFFLMALQSIMDEVAEAINTDIIPKFIDWNFGSGRYPKFQWGNFTDDQAHAINMTFDRLSTAGQSSTVTPEFMFELEKLQAKRLGFEIDYDSLEEEMLAEKERLKAEQIQFDALQAQEIAQAPAQDPAAGGDVQAPTTDETPKTDEELRSVYLSNFVTMDESLLEPTQTSETDSVDKPDAES
jgi:hypothetical protein